MGWNQQQGHGGFAMGAPPAGQMGMGASRGAPQQGRSGMGCVTLVNNLPENVTMDMIFTLCSVYGRVDRVKILFNKRSSALVQFAAPSHAESAVKHLLGCPMYDNELHVIISKHAGIATSGKDSEDLTKDFSTVDPRDHRFAGHSGDPKSEKALSQACPPSAVLHLANIAATMSVDEIRNMFTAFGTIVNFKQLPQKPDQKRVMYLLELSSPKEAVIALLNLHSFVLPDGNKLKVSFTKSTIKES